MSPACPPHVPCMSPACPLHVPCMSPCMSPLSPACPPLVPSCPPLVPCMPPACPLHVPCMSPACPLHVPHLKAAALFPPKHVFLFCALRHGCSPQANVQVLRRLAQKHGVAGVADDAIYIYIHIHTYISLHHISLHLPPPSPPLFRQKSFHVYTSGAWP